MRRRITCVGDRMLEFQEQPIKPIRLGLAPPNSRRENHWDRRSILEHNVKRVMLSCAVRDREALRKTESSELLMRFGG